MLLWRTNGGDETLLSYTDGMDEEEFLRWWEIIPDAHWQFIRETQIEFVTEQYHFVHAGLLPEGKYWEGQDRGFDPRLWIREPFLSSKDLFDGRVVVFGHTPQTGRRILTDKNKIGIDTGAVFGGPLTAAVIDPDARIRRVPSPDVIQADYISTR
jgi:serine/threonine protein phosphatase 1